MKFFIVVLLFVSLNAFSDDSTATVTVVVQAAINVIKYSDLDFGTSFSGDTAKTVSPVSGAKFLVTGEPNRAFTVTLPSSVSMVTGGGATANEQIAVTSFSSSPSGSTSLDGVGLAKLAVGATRAAIPNSQTAGDYSVPFTVVVTYQ